MCVLGLPVLRVRACARICASSRTYVYVYLCACRLEMLQGLVGMTLKSFHPVHQSDTSFDRNLNVFVTFPFPETQTISSWDVYPISL